MPIDARPTSLPIYGDLLARFMCREVRDEAVNPLGGKTPAISVGPGWQLPASSAPIPAL